MRRLLFALSLAFAALAARAEQFQRYDDYVVHYAAFRSDQLAPEIARAAGIVQHRERGVVLVNVQHAPIGLPSNPVAARVNGKARSLLGRAQALEFREYREDGAIDLLAQLPVSHAELTVFDLEIHAEGVSTPFKLQFRQTFYTD